MGWSDCGKDSKGRPIGYVFKAKCDHPDCNEDIDRGLSYACGDMHGKTEVGCEGYFCPKHRATWVRSGGETHTVCDDCYEALRVDPDWVFDEEEFEFFYAPEQK